MENNPNKTFKSNLSDSRDEPGSVIPAQITAMRVLIESLNTTYLTACQCGLGRRVPVKELSIKEAIKIIEYLNNVYSNRKMKEV